MAWRETGARVALPRWVRAGALCLASGALAACSSDLFHGTTWPSLCESNPADPACSVATSGGSGGAGGGAGGQGGGSTGPGGAGGAGGAPPPVWSRAYGDAVDQFGTSVALAPNGDVLLTGRHLGVLDLGLPGGVLTSAGLEDIFLARLDPTGQPLWGKGYGDALSQFAKNVVVNPAGELVWTGYFDGSVDFGGGALPAAAVQDAYLVKLDGAGQQVFASAFSGGGQQRANQVALGPGGAIAIVGTFGNTMTVGAQMLTTTGAKDIFVVKLDGAGGITWAKSFGDIGDQNGVSVAFGPTGAVFLAGFYVGSLPLGGAVLPAALTPRPWVAKLDGMGNHVWSRDLGASTACTSPDIAVDSSGDVIVVGGFSGPLDLDGGMTSAGGMDVFIAKLNGNTGVDEWSLRAGDASEQSAVSVAVDGSGRVVVAGSLAGTADFAGGGAIVSAGGTDVFLVRLSSGGTHLATDRYGDAGIQEPADVAVRGADHVVLTGWFDGVLDFGAAGTVTAAPPAAGTAPTLDVFVAQLAL